MEGCWEVCLWSFCATSKVVQDDLLKDPPGCILVYTDIVTDTVIGDTNASLLAVLPLPAQQSPTKFTPSQLAYHRVKVKQLTAISIKLADLYANELKFDGETDTIVLIELHFRRVPV